ncbi:hypothetical protein AK830_g7013 [Neonectria ditissima]|uniref:Uncharacterized protein n=1 Tax=Neonectria ditissima TaxID=78410 RepID=A0A0P7BF42_9HYPO|nr:hypothetical protein AK830_g7013 [Neonectria ditissima]
MQKPTRYQHIVRYPISDPPRLQYTLTTAVFMKAFVLLLLACLAVSLPSYAGTPQADLDLPDSVYESGKEENGIPFIRRIKAHLALADPTSLPAPTAATPSNAALSRRRLAGFLILRPRPWRPRVSSRPRPNVNTTRQADNLSRDV